MLEKEGVMTIWKKEEVTGMLVCGVCGLPKLEKESCCKTAPFISFDEFRAKYFPNCHHDYKSKDTEHYVPLEVTETFYDDYLHSNYDSLQEYIEKTSKKI